MLLPGSVRNFVNCLNNFLVDDFAFQSKGNGVLFIVFAGMPGILKTLARVKQKIGIQTRPFEFVHSFQERHCDVIFLRDRYRAYYHSGVKGVGRNVDEVAGFLNDFIGQGRYRLVVTLGHSMGGYASLLFASKVDADICIAISAQTFLDLENIARYGDYRYHDEKKRLYRSKHQSPVYYDLRNYFLSKTHASDRKSCTYCLFYGENDRLDRIHATRMTGIGHPFHIYEVKGAGHNTAREMRDSGVHVRLFDKILSLNSRKNVNSLLKSLEVEGSVSQPLSPSWLLS